MAKKKSVKAKDITVVLQSDSVGVESMKVNKREIAEMLIAEREHALDTELRNLNKKTGEFSEYLSLLPKTRDELANELVKDNEEIKKLEEVLKAFAVKELRYGLATSLSPKQDDYIRSKYNTRFNVCKVNRITISHMSNSGSQINLTYKTSKESQEKLDAFNNSVAEAFKQYDAIESRIAEIREEINNLRLNSKLITANIIRSELSKTKDGQLVLSELNKVVNKTLTLEHKG